MGKGCNDYAEISLRRTSKCGGTMKVVAFIIEHAVVDRIVDHVGLTFVADKSPPSREDFSPAPQYFSKKARGAYKVCKTKR